MKTKFTLIILFSLFSYFGSGQLADGSIAPDWTLDQINTDCGGFGQTWNLYTQLNAGKHVVIDFSAIWCPPCWSYHNGGALETLWEEYGPNGDNTIRVFYIEADCSTNSDCLCDLPTCNGNSQGNWMAGTAYPVFSPEGNTCTNINNGYQINYFPTLYAINAQHGTAWEVGQVGVSGWESWLFESFTLDGESFVTNDICGDGSGAIDIEVTGGYGNLSYTWNTGATTQDLLNVPEGTYSVRIRDANGYFIDITDIEVEGSTNPLLVNPGTIEHNLCYGASEGSIEIEVEGGVTPYTFVWSNGATTQNISGLVAGEYSVTISDGNDCEKVIEAEVEEPFELIVNPTATEASCGLNNGSIFLSPNGGTPPYFYLLNGDIYLTNDFYDLAPGVYIVGVNDYNDCEVTEEIVIGAIPLPVSNAGPDKSLPCSGGTVQLNGNGSSSGAQWGYLWTTTNGHIVSGATTKTPIVDAVGTYTLRVKDNVYSCESFDETVVTTSGELPAVSIATPGQLTCVATTVNVDGSQSASGSNITYQWNTTNGHIVSGQNASIAIVDQPGDYTLVVTNTTTLCSAQSSVQVLANTSVPSAIATNAVISCGQPNVEICVTVSGSYQSFQWQNGSENLCISVSSPGEYGYTVTGNNGCQFSGFSIVTGDNTLPVSDIAEHSKLQCGATTISLTGAGSSTGNDYSYLWSTPNGNIVGQNNTLTITVDKSGKYFLQVINNTTNCTSLDSTIVENGPSAPDAEFTHGINYNVVNLVGIDNPYSTSTWSSGGITQQGNTASFSFNDNGVYNICHTITNDCGTETICADVNITAILPLTFTSNEIDVKCHGENNGSISVNAAGGVGIYTYNWTGPQGFTASGNSISNLAPGTYTVVITDSGNHIVSQSITIDQPELITTLTVITPASSNESNGAIDMTVFGGISPYTYLWSNGATTQDLINVAQGTYTVTITDANLCVYVTSYTVVTTLTNEIANDLIFNVYPNPTSDKVFIDLNAAELSGSELMVTDMKGRLIMKRIINSVDNTISIDMSDLNGGVYMLKIENSKVSVIRKLVRM